MRLIFLDIDGVMNYVRRGRTTSSTVVRGDKLRILLRVLRRTGSGLVLTSALREEAADLAKVREHFGEFFGMTPVLPGQPRGEEIAAWLAQFSERGGTVTRYVVLDDLPASEFLEDQLPNFFQTDETVGLTDEIADRMIAHLREGMS